MIYSYIANAPGGIWTRGSAIKSRIRYLCVTGAYNYKTLFKTFALTIFATYFKENKTRFELVIKV